MPTSWRVQLDQTRGSEIQNTRPCVVVTTDVLNERRRTVVVVPCSSSPQASPPLLIAVRLVGRAAVAVLDQARAVAKGRLQERIGVLDRAELAAIEDGCAKSSNSNGSGCDPPIGANADLVEIIAGSRSDTATVPRFPLRRRHPQRKPLCRLRRKPRRFADR
ncbi:MAG: type II toxin-antitoxin system PemK/MazF family toxin [Vulcanimicrobiaceae bacterium]